MSSAALKRFVTPEEYLVAERRSEVKHEYLRGVITAMAGASRQHNRVTVNLAAELRDRLKGRPCEAFVNDMRVLVEDTGLYTYPDAAVVCGDPRFLDAELDILLNPVAIVEVLSPSTEAYDRGKKFDHYRRIPSLAEYVLVAQDRPAVDRYTRRGDEWVLVPSRGLEDALVLETAGVRIPLAEIYDRVEFPDGGDTG